MVKPGGTGSPKLAISAKFAPLPPNRSRRPALPSAWPSPKVNTHLPDFTAVAASLCAPGLFAAGLAATFFNALRAEATGAALARAGADGFDFAAIFFVFVTALAMTYNNPREERVARLTPFCAVLRKPAKPFDHAL